MSNKIAICSIIILAFSGISGFYFSSLLPTIQPVLDLQSELVIEGSNWYGYYNYMCLENWLHTYESGKVTKHQHEICNI